jgi:hypothetical protein
MGLKFPDLGVCDHKALIEPLTIVDGALAYFLKPDIRLTRHAVAGAAE